MWTELTYNIGVVLYVYLVCVIIFFMLMENRNPVKTIAWILVLVFIPIFGVLFYILLGKKFRKKHIISKRSLRILKTYEASAANDFVELPMTETQRSIAKLAVGSCDAAVFENNSLELFTEGKQMFERMFQDIEKAQHHIHFEFYILCPDTIGRRMMDALMKKAREGVEVRMIIDDVGSWKLKRKHLRELKEAGVQVNSFLEVGLPFINSRVNYRNHRKILIVDGCVGYTGGMNVADRYVDGLKWGIWRDTHARLEGSAVLELQKTFLEDWYFVEQVLIEDKCYYPEPKPAGRVMAQTLVSGPDMQWESIMQVFTKAFNLAKKRIYIETPYFLPPESIVTALQSAALSGVDVRLILPYRSDAVVTLYSSYSYFDHMFDAGVKVYLYQPGFIHSKVTVVDDDIAFVGSANMDFRSFEQNFEMNTILYDAEATRQLTEIFEKDLKQSELLDKGVWSERSLWHRLMESLARLFSPIL